MAINLTGKREKFAQGVFSGLSLSDAYRKAYDTANMAPSTVNKRAKELSKDQRIQDRIQALAAPVVEKLRQKYEYSLAHAMGEAQEAFQVSKDQKSGASMTAAVALRAKLNGLLIERKEVVITEVQKLDDASLDALIALKAGELGILVGATLANLH